MKKDLDKKPSKGLPPTPEVPVSAYANTQQLLPLFTSLSLPFDLYPFLHN